jgi:iron complex transport system substrate-binding protein
VEEAVYAWTGARPKIVSLNPNSLADIWEDIRAVAKALDAEERGEALITALKHRMQATQAQAATRMQATLAPPTARLQAAAQAQPATRTTRPSVACIEWIDPLMAAGNWVPELVEMAGGRNLFGEAGKHSPWMTWEALKASDPDVIVVLPCGWGIERSSREMPTLEALPGWAALKAVKGEHVYLTDGNQYFNRPGPRVVESLEILEEIFRDFANEQGFRHHGSGWKRWP